MLWKFEKGKRSSVKWIRDTPKATHQWHDLKVRVTGTKLEAYLDGKRYLEHVLPAPVSGRVVGLWSKADGDQVTRRFLARYPWPPRVLAVRRAMRVATAAEGSIERPFSDGRARMWSA